jgi:RHS repeat-associated protein
LAAELRENQRSTFTKEFYKFRSVWTKLGVGAVRLITDANAQVVNRYDYDSYGRPLTTIEGVWQPFRWKAREFLGGGVDVYYNRARFYDPQLGRFTSEDPLGYRAGDSNLFAFGWNNPKRWNDPSGKAAVVEIAVLSLAVMIAAPAVAYAGCKLMPPCGHRLLALLDTTILNKMAVMPVEKEIPNLYRRRWFAQSPAQTFRPLHNLGARASV